MISSSIVLINRSSDEYRRTLKTQSCFRCKSFSMSKGFMIRIPYLDSGLPDLRIAPVVFSGLTFYLLLPVTMLFPFCASRLLCVAVGVIASHAMLPLSSANLPIFLPVTRA